MGLLDKIFGGNSDKGNVSTEINESVESYYSKQNDSEKEMQLRKQAGEDVEDWCISESRRKGLPYDCFSDLEIEIVEEANGALDNLKGTLRLLTCAQYYLQNNEKLDSDNLLRNFNIQHALLWIDRLCDRAEKGSIYARSAVVSDYFVIINNPEIYNRIEAIVGDSKEEYRQIIMEQIDQNNPHAMLGYAFFMLFGNENLADEKKKFLRRAGELGLSEAYDQLLFSVDDHWNSQEGFEIVLAAAECDDGDVAYQYQDRLGDAYWYAENWIKEQDKERALYWYRRAAQNGYKTSISTLEMLKNNGEI